MVKYKLQIERSLCIGCGNCTFACPEYWEMAEDGFSHLKGSIKVGDNEEREVEDPGCNREAEEQCPVSCIHVFEIE
ncbi:MAG: ferredoxin [ANME-2 cluster archaeon]|nr:ferredoxin [ANME-2 cluster archaeon]